MPYSLSTLSLIPALSLSKILPYSLGATAFDELVTGKPFNRKRLNQICSAFKNYPQVLSAAYIGVSFFGSAGAAPLIFTSFAAISGLCKVVHAIQNLQGDFTYMKGTLNQNLDRVASAINVLGAGFMLWTNPANTLMQVNAVVQFVNII